MIIPTGYCQVNLIFGGTSAPRGAQMTFGVQNASGLDVGTIGGLIGTKWATRFAVQCANTLTLVGCLVKAGPNSTGLAVLVPFGLSGTQAATGTQPQVSVLIRKRSTIGGRGGLGRLFHPGGLENQIDTSGFVDPTYRTGWQTAATGFLADLLAAQVPMALLHTTPAAPVLVTSLDVEGQVATQRRRLRK
jgi:hypothetical protein